MTIHRHWNEFENQLRNKITSVATADDPAHDLLHFERVVESAKALARQESADLNIVVPAAWLHDLVIVRKDDPRRKQASRLSAEAAVQFLTEIGYPSQYFDSIAHAIEAHSFSAAIPIRSLEAAVVQDADRLDGLGAIGIARCFATAGILKRGFYSSEDPFCQTRVPNDQVHTIDHFYQKLFKTVDTLQTKAGKAEGQRRKQFMETYLQQLSLEIGYKSTT